MSATAAAMPQSDLPPSAPRRVLAPAALTVKPSPTVAPAVPGTTTADSAPASAQPRAPMAPQRPGAADSAGPNSPARPTSTAAPPLTDAPAAIAITQRPAAALVAALPTPAPAEPAPSQPKPPLPAAAPAQPPPPSQKQPPEPRVELPDTGFDSTGVSYEVRANERAYSKLSSRFGESGRVSLRVEIGFDGKALRVEITQSSGFQRIDEGIVKFAQQWRFVPGRIDGVPSTMWLTILHKFELK
ncbi:MAG: TonB family protein [Betaproteobacteria bacterium]|nr:TonB family protein [Betaproteobacteria bacterium]